MSKTITGTWKYPDGTAIAGGILTLKLSQDAVVTGTNQVASTKPIQFTLDTNGAIPASTTILANDELTPSGTVYTLTVMAPGGGVEYGPQSFSIAGASPINLNNSTPTAQNVVLPNAVLTNPTAQQKISSFPLELGTSLILDGATSGSTTLTAAATAGGTATLPNNTGTIAELNLAQSFTAAQTFTAGILGPGFQRQIFNSSGTFTIAAGITQVRLTVVGGGGSGSNGTSSTGGGSGGCSLKWASGLTPGSTMTVTVGTGGAGVTVAGSGNAGNASTVVSASPSFTVTANGGGAGANNGEGQGGSAGSGGDLNFGGSSGGPTNPNTSNAGTGGPSIFGGGMNGPASGAGTAGAAPGAGGSGTQANGGGPASGAGANGIVFFEWLN